MTIDEIEEALEAITNLSRATKIKEDTILQQIYMYMPYEEWLELKGLWLANQ